MSAALVAFLFSIGAGGFGSMVGIGGGLVIVPVMTVLLHYDIKVAIGASLVGVIATSMSATAHYLSTGIADRRLGVTLLVATALGGLTGGLTARLLDARTLALLFGILLLLVALQMLRQLRGRAHPTAAEGAEADALETHFDSHYVEPTTGQTVTYRARRIPLGTAVSFLAGNVSGLLGVGGGIINVPTMNVLMGVPIRVATTTSTYMLGATAAASAVLYEASGELNPLLAAPVALGVIVGARAGARLSMRVSQRALRLLFVAVALFFAAQMFAKALG